LLLVGAAGFGYGVGTLMDAPQVSVPERPKHQRPVAVSAVATPRLTAEPRRNEAVAQAIPTPSTPMPNKSVATTPRTVPSATAEAPTDEPAMSSPAAGLAIETRLIRQSHQAIVSGDFGGALTLLGEHERRFPAGVLTEERVATQLIAYCRSGRGAEAQARLQQFASRWPKSPHLSRIRSACAHLDTGH
jgi:TolA-binding protein